MFKARVALAATLSGNYGIYNGFELLEHEPIPGKEEYLNSEKYELKVRDWNKPGNIKDYIGRLNRIRRGNPALLQTSNLRFAQVDDDEVIGFVKESVRRRQCGGGRGGVGEGGPAGVLVPFRRHRDRPARRAAARQGDRKPDHRRAARPRMGRRPLAHRSAAGSRAAVPLLRVKVCRERRSRHQGRSQARKRRAVVQGRDHLSAARQGVRRQQQRRHRRFRRPDREARLSAGSRRHRALAAAVLSLARPRRRLRHLGLSPHQSRFRHHAGFPPLHAGSQAPKAAGDHRARHQSHLRSASLVRARAPQQADVRCPQLVRLERQRPELRRNAHHLQRHREIELDLGPRGRGLLLASLLLASAGSQLTTIRAC